MSRHNNLGRMTADDPYNHKCDVWSLGCILYEMLTLSRAFEADGQGWMLAMHRISRGPLPQVPTHVDSATSALVYEMLNRDPRQRPDMRQVLANELVMRYVMIVATDMGMVAVERPLVQPVTRPALANINHESSTTTPATAKRQLRTRFGGICVAFSIIHLQTNAPRRVDSVGGSCSRRHVPNCSRVGCRGRPRTTHR